MAVFSGSGLSCERGERIVFAGVSFSMPSGSVTELRGGNGSGKSTLLRMMAGLLPPSAGTVAWNEESIAADRQAHSARTHYVGHLDGVKGMLTARENLRFWAEMTGAHPRAKSIDEQVELALAAFGIAKLADMPARSLSAGQRRRVALARLIVRPAQIWLLDEPSTALDTAALAALDHVLAAHLGAGGIVIMATHEAMRRDNPCIDLDAHARAAAKQAAA